MKVPANATREQKELIQNLENIRRERDVEEEYKKLKDRITGTEELSKQEKTKKLLDKSAKIIKKGQKKPTGFTGEVVKNKKNKLEEKFIKLQKSDDKVKLNSDFVLGLGVVNEQEKIETKLMNIAKSNFKSPVKKTSKKIVNIYDNGKEDIQTFHYDRDIKQSDAQQHLSNHHEIDKKIQKNNEKNDDVIGMKNLANAYRKYIKAQETH